MTKTRRLILLLTALLLPGFPMQATSGAAQEGTAAPSRWRWHGALGLFGKYDANLELVPHDTPLPTSTDSFGMEGNIRLAVERSFGPAWWFEARLVATGNGYVERSEENWYHGNVGFSLNHTRGANLWSLYVEPRFYTVPGENEFDFFRNTAILSWQRSLSERTVVTVGYENLLARYPETESLDHVIHGAFSEVRLSLSPDLSTQFSYGFQFYQGHGESEEHPFLNSPSYGFRHTATVGLDAAFLGENTLFATYSLQLDTSSGESLHLVSAFEGDEETLDVETEFNFLEQKGTLLYTHRFPAAISASLFVELISKSFFNPEELFEIAEHEHADLLLTVVPKLALPLTPAWEIDLRYIFRMNASTRNEEDFHDHVVNLGLTFRF